MRASVAGFAFALACGVGSAFGCAPSHRLVHDGNVYFEHCYGADFNPAREREEREACWNAWLAYYTKHQATHRVDYAMRRLEALQAGESSLSLPGITSGIPHLPASSPEEIGESEVQQSGLVTLHGPSAQVSPVFAATTDVAIPHGCGRVCDALDIECAATCPADSSGCRQHCAHERAVCLGGCY